jgi:hypothetical protein
VHEDAVLAFKSLVARASILLLVPLIVVLLVVWWQFA